MVKDEMSGMQVSVNWYFQINLIRWTHLRYLKNFLNIFRIKYFSHFNADKKLFIY